MKKRPEAQFLVCPTETERFHKIGYKFTDGSRIWVRYPVDASFSETAEGTVLPEHFDALIEDDRLPYRVQINFDVDRGRPSPQALSVWSPWTGPVVEITSERLRRIPVARLINLAIVAAAHLKPRRKGSQPRARSLEDFRAAYLERGERSPRPKQLDDEHYRKVRDVYRAALAMYEAPTLAVATRFTVSPSTAARWVGEARRRGELDPAPGPGLAGEVTKPQRKGTVKRP